MTPPPPTPTSGPSPTPPPAPIAVGKERVLLSPLGPVYRFYDPEAGVVCYMAEKTEIKRTYTLSHRQRDQDDAVLGIGTGLALSCLPVEDTWLSKE
jgi:hypothetical protein